MLIKLVQEVLIMKKKLLLAALSLMLLVPLTFASANDTPGKTEGFSSVGESNYSGIEKHTNRFSLEKNFRFREKFGLNSDLSYIQDLINFEKQSGGSTGEEFGVVLTKTEEEGFIERMNFHQSKIPQIRQYINEFISDGFAEIYINQKNGGTINIGFVNNLDTLQDKMNKIMEISERPEMIKFYQAKYSESQLNDLHEEIYSSKKNLKNKGIDIVSIRTDIINEKVVIGVSQLNELVSNELFVLFPKEMITVIEDVPGINKMTSETYTRPIQAGLKIFENGGGSCTAGFSAQKKASTDLYIITAGHCPDFIGSAYSQGGSSYSASNKFGEATIIQYGGRMDAAAIAADSSEITYWLYGDGISQYRNLKSTKTLGTETVGETACISGGNADAINCGEVLSTNYSSGSLHSMVEADFYAINGDSGSPIFFGYELLGILSGGPSDYRNYYPKIGYILNDLSINAILGGP
jgi:hypothetical protein